MRSRWAYVELVGSILGGFGLLATLFVCPHPLLFGEPCDFSRVELTVGLVLGLAGAGLVLAGTVDRRLKSPPKSAVV